MTITFFSNFFNHHQLPFSKEIIKIKGVNYKFVVTEKIPEDRLNLGYSDMNSLYDFVVKSYENEEEAYKLADNSDVVIIGSAPNKYIKNRLKKKKLTFRYSERIFKSGFNLKLWLSMIKNYSILEKNVYLLCSSAYAANDFNRAFCYKNRTFKWGYFPENIEYDINKLLLQKRHNKKINLLWVGRFIDWKHPEKAIYVANNLVKKNIDFSLDMIGIGEEMSTIKKLISKYNLNKYVTLIGSVEYKKVRKYMEKANIFLFTSDYNEGWGAVLNEAMNSGCTVIASHAIGSVPFLLKHNYNGIIYENDNIDDLLEKTYNIIHDYNLQYAIGYNAYHTIQSTWNAKVAASNFISLIKSIQEDKKVLIKDGPCSKALSISNKEMYSLVMKGMNDEKNNK